jgi:heme/copper-type cytochrome/quinol oxidase subunit 2
MILPSGRAETSAALEVTVIGHQFWWEFRYPALHHDGK